MSFLSEDGMKRALAIVLACLITSAAFAEQITVAAAISLKDALDKVADQYKADTGDTVGFTLGSSGQLANQILNGAPIDLFISAANKQVDDLSKQGMLDDTTRKPRVKTFASPVRSMPPTMRRSFTPPFS